MTDPLDPSAPGDIDEVASALLDGELDHELDDAAATARAGATTHPDVRARMARLAEVRAALQAPVPVDAARREAAIAAALDAAGPGRGGRTVVALRRRPRLAVAAVAAAVALAVPVVATLTDGRQDADDDLATATLDATEGAAGSSTVGESPASGTGPAAPEAGSQAGRAYAEDAGAAGDDAAGGAAEAAVEAGPVDSLAAIVPLLASSPAPVAGGTGETAPDATRPTRPLTPLEERCVERHRAVAPGASPVAVATLGEVPVVVVAHGDPVVLVALDAACEVVAELEAG